MPNTESKVFVKQGKSIVEEITIVKKRVIDPTEVEDRLAILNKTLAELPALKTEPDIESMNFWNESVRLRIQRGIESAIAQLKKDKQDIEKANEK